MSAGLVKALTIGDDGAVRFVLEVPPSQADAFTSVRDAAEAAVTALGPKSVSVIMTAHSTPAAPPDLKPQRSAEPKGPQKIPGVDRIIAIASGKGGVGKSTVASNLALALSAAGHRVGLLDADIYGPSQPRMMGISGRPQSPDGSRLDPMENYGIKVRSIGFLVPEDTAMIWRGPMVMSALQQLMRDVNWGELDIMIVDMPPGTGDAQLTMAQDVPLAGAVIVSTPQDIALLDARKGINMFQKVEVPVLGIVENMSYFSCPHCGERTDIFSHGGARTEAEKFKVDFLGEVPLDILIRQTSDEGRPIVVSNPDSEHSKVFREIADRLWDKIEGAGAPPKMPNIVMQ